jgi:hypothetical protein
MHFIFVSVAQVVDCGMFEIQAVVIDSVSKIKTVARFFLKNRLTMCNFINIYFVSRFLKLELQIGKQEDTSPVKQSSMKGDVSTSIVLKINH